MPKISSYDPWSPAFGPYDAELNYQAWDAAGPLAELLWSETFDRESIAEGWALSREGYKLSKDHTYGAEHMGPAWHKALPQGGAFEDGQDVLEFILGRAIDGSARHLLACRLLGILPVPTDG